MSRSESHSSQHLAGLQCKCSSSSLDLFNSNLSLPLTLLRPSGSQLCGGQGLQDSTELTTEQQSAKYYAALLIAANAAAAFWGSSQRRQHMEAVIGL